MAHPHPEIPKVPPLGTVSCFSELDILCLNASKHPKNIVQVVDCVHANEASKDD